MTHAEHPAPPRKSTRGGPNSELGSPLVTRLAATLDKVDEALALPDATEMIHDARKAIKEYRALLRLMASEAAKTARRRAAETARGLSSSRDRQACRDALADLNKTGHLGDEDMARALEAVDREGDGTEDAFRHVDSLREWLSQARSSHAEVLDAEAAETDILGGARRAYRKARAADDFSAAEPLHDLRKRVVIHRYQMSFLADLPGDMGMRRPQRAQKLRDILGAYQDIETLRGHIHGAGEHLDDEIRARVLEAADRRQGKLQRKARGLHAALFRRKPKAFSRKLSRKFGPAKRIGLKLVNASTSAGG